MERNNNYGKPSVVGRSGGYRQPPPPPHEMNDNYNYYEDDDDDDNDDKDRQSSDDNNHQLMDVLDNFRENWRKELLFSPTTQTSATNRRFNDTIDNSSDDMSITDVDLKAMELFKEGSLLEQRGKLYDAVAYYRRATQLVPDIEFKMYRLEAQMMKKASADDSNTDNNSVDDDNNTNRSDIDGQRGVADNDSDEFDPNDDLITRFLRSNTDEFGNFWLCSPKQLTTNTTTTTTTTMSSSSTSTSRAHFSCLPIEVVLNILKWIVSNELDLRSLEQFGSVCRGFYIVSRDSELWRLSCHNTWGSNSSVSTGGTAASAASAYGHNWRRMFIDRQRPNFNGAYISRTQYIRQGDISFNDYYRPCILVEYYRYIRFFPNGHVLMLTTADDPRQSLPLLRQRQPKNNNNVLSGHYRINGPTIAIVLHREYVADDYTQLSARNTNKYGKKTRDRQLATQTFNITLELRNVRHRRNHQLVWQQYSVSYRKPNNGGGGGQESGANDFDLTGNKFPPFWFSRVKSYAANADHKLN
ncbi:F-box only protein 9-like [Oppia nitens]|uniref:F-box only protein 9-like n=1 Tax=Oppia nitens TaxID=1686743 RepID=UPI0023D9B80A|nr:F-box only protein 9-like [Oppia nitens]